MLLLLSVTVILLWIPETIPRHRKKWLSPLEGAKRVFEVYLSSGQPYQRLLLWLGLLAFFFAELPEMSDTKVSSQFMK